MAVVLFDGVCNLCNASVRFIIARDPHGRFRFAPLTSQAATTLLRSAPVSATLSDSVVLIEEGRVFTRSDAALRIAKHLAFPWPLAYALVVLPRFLRDRVYDLVARHRYRWFGRREACMVPARELRDRFL